MTEQCDRKFPILYRINIRMENVEKLRLSLDSAHLNVAGCAYTNCPSTLYKYMYNKCL